MKITTSISKSLGFESQTSIAELREDRVTISLATPPQKAGAIWQRYNRLVLKRHKGTRLEIVKVWEFGSNSYVKDQYPD